MTASPPRLTIVLSTALLGGTERQMLLYLRHHDRARVRPRVVVAQTHELSDRRHLGSITEKLEEVGVPYRVTPAPRFFHPRGLAFLARELWQSSDVTMLFGFAIGWTGRLLMWPRSGRVICGIRNENAHRSWATMKMEGLLSPLVDLYVSNSHAARDYYAKEALISKEKIVIIPNSLDVTDLRRTVPSSPRQRLRAEFDLPQDALVGVNISNIRPRKGHRDIIEAFSRLETEYPDLYFLFVGEDQTGGAVKRYIGELGLKGRILMTGFRDDISALIAGSDLMVHPSYSEGMSNSIMEGMALGLPILASDVGDNRLLLEASGAGIVCEAGSIEALTRALRLVLSADDRRERWGIRGAALAEREFSVATYIERTHRVVEELAAGADAADCHEALRELAG